MLSVWRRSPQQARFRGPEHFGKLYDKIFTSDLSGAQVVIAVLLFRIAENKRKRPPPGAPEFVRYASCFATMRMGEYLLADLGIGAHELDHRRFAAARTLVETRGDAYFERAVERLQRALSDLYGERRSGSRDCRPRSGVGICWSCSPVGDDRVPGVSSSLRKG